MTNYEKMFGVTADTLVEMVIDARKHSSLQRTAMSIMSDLQEFVIRSNFSSADKEHIRQRLNVVKYLVDQTEDR